MRHVLLDGLDTDGGLVREENKHLVCWIILLLNHEHHLVAAIDKVDGDELKELDRESHQLRHNASPRRSSQQSSRVPPQFHRRSLCVRFLCLF